jgi:hypothetical protein
MELFYWNSIVSRFDYRNARLLLTFDSSYLLRRYLIQSNWQL